MVKGVVAGGSVQTVEAGAEMMRAGGNAVDAAVAAAFACFVAECSISTLGGGGFATVYGPDLEPVVYVGREGITDSLVQSSMDALKTRELIKVKLGQNCTVPKQEAATRLAEATGAALVQLIGKTIILYLPNRDLKPDQRISLPK